MALLVLPQLNKQPWRCRLCLLWLQTRRCGLHSTPLAPRRQHHRSTFEPEIGAKWFEVLIQAAPRTRHVGVLMDPEFRAFSDLWDVIRSTAPSLGMQAFQLEARDSATIDDAIQQFSHQTNAGVIVLPTPANAVHRERILSLTSEHRLPRFIHSPIMPKRVV